MKLKSIRLEGFRGFKNIEIQFDDRTTLLVGVNGAGKSSILDAIALMLSWIPARIRNEKGNGQSVKDLDVHNEESFSSIELSMNDGNSWRIVKTKKNKSRSSITSDYAFVNQKAIEIKNQISENRGIPLFVFYPVNRAVLDIPLRIRKRHTFDELDAYEGALTSGANFRSFFEWFRTREDLENEKLREKLEENQALTSEQLGRDVQLSAVRNAIEQFIPGFDQLKVQRNPLRMTVRKEGRTLQINQLSDGEKCLLAMIGDLARRLAIGNPGLDNPLEGQGIVLIDEIELHLHPTWQRTFVQQALDVFPNCQFIISTHSPQALGEVAGAQIRLLQEDSIGEMSVSIPPQAYGFDSNLILEVLMGTPSKNKEVDQALLAIFELINDEAYDKAKAKLADLRIRMNGDLPEMIRAETLIDMMSTPLAHD